MKRLSEARDPALAELTELVQSAEPHKPNPFAKRLVHSRLTRALATPRSRRPGFLWAAGGIVLLAGSAAAASYSMWGPSEPARSELPLEAPPQPAAPAPLRRAAPAPALSEEPAPSEEPTVPPVASVPEKASEQRPPRPRSGEDPTQVAEAVRALRKQGDAARAQAMLERYLRDNPRGVLAEDALALSIEAAVARKDPRAADYARRYLARYPNGRFRAQAERALTPR